MKTLSINNRLIFNYFTFDFGKFEYLIKCIKFKQPLLFNTLQVRSALGASQRRKLSFKNVSNVVVHLLHGIKFSMEVPFSHIYLKDTSNSFNYSKHGVSILSN